MPTPSKNQPTFASLDVPAPIVKILERQHMSTAFPIQADSLPDTLSGRDVLGRGRTGSGKTLAFGIPMVAALGAARVEGEHHPGHPVGLVLAPTRELATQIAEVIDPLAGAYGLRVTTIFGGVKQARQERALSRGADIVVACPGRLEDLMQQRIVALDRVDVTVIDEADYMADLGFLPGVTRILNATPGDGQRMLFSATLDNGVDVLVKRFLHNPALHAVSDPTETVSTMEHYLLKVATPERKKAVVRQLASGTGKRILFMRTKHAAQRLAKQLTAAGIPAVDLQGNLSQNARDRHLAAFESDEVNVLVATDVAARGVDVDGVAMVIHVDPPADFKTYLHRSGRTARAGSHGCAVTVVIGKEERDMTHIFKQAHIDVLPQPVDERSPFLDQLIGERAAHVEPTPQERALGREQPRERSGQRSGYRSGRGGSSRNGSSSRSSSSRSNSSRNEGGRNGRRRSEGTEGARRSHREGEAEGSYGQRRNSAGQASSHAPHRSFNGSRSQNGSERGSQHSSNQHHSRAQRPTRSW